MSDEKLVFVKQTDIPKMGRGKTGRDYKSIFSQIPVGSALKIGEDSLDVSGASVRDAVKRINDEAEKKLYAVVQRTSGDETTFYVVKL